MSLQDYEQDIKELQKLLEMSERKAVQTILNDNIKQLNLKINKLRLEEKKKIELQQQKQSETSSKSQKQLPTKTITNYSFDQEGPKVKIYIFLDNIGDIPRENITHQFQKDSIQLDIQNYQNSNYLFKIPQLFSEIVTESSKIIIKQNRITFILIKKENKFWDQLIFKEKKFKDTDVGDSKDPQAGLMNLMKQMYNEGDDDMKRTLNKAWSESQEKKMKGMDM